MLKVWFYYIYFFSIKFVDADVFRALYLVIMLSFATFKMFPDLQNCSVHNTRSAIGTCKVVDMDGSVHRFLILYGI